MSTIVLMAPIASVASKGAEELIKMDPYGIGMSVIAMSIVFLALIIIYFIYKYLAKILLYRSKIKTQKIAVPDTPVSIHNNEIPAEVGAAISLAIHLYNNSQHDLDSLTLTIQKVSRMYSPWSSKIYTLRQLPR